ncbi:helix-turn-helix domain-containing protein [Saliphagus sp. GCM10025308]
MSVTLEFTVENDQFTLGQVLSGPPSMRIELERIVPTGTSAMPFLWVSGEDYASFEEKVVSHRFVEDIIAIDRVENAVLYRVTWHDDHTDLIRGITDAQGTVLQAFSNGGWEFHVRFPDHDKLSQFHNYTTDSGISIHINRTYTVTERTESVHQFGLSDEQREALVLGLRRGYFDTPSEASLDELADELGISQQAVSNRVRRGTKQVLSEILLSTAADFD